MPGQVRNYYGGKESIMKKLIDYSSILSFCKLCDQRVHHEFIYPGNLPQSIMSI
jgi:hypothetical protein